MTFCIISGLYCLIKLTAPQELDLIQQKDLQIQALTAKLHSSHLQIRILQDQVEQLLRRIYGRRSERLDPNQLWLDPLILDALRQSGAPSLEPLAELPVDKVPEKKPVERAKREHPGRIPIPEHLERVEIVLDVPDKDKVCPETGEPLKPIGWEVSEKLEYRPGKLIVNVYKRPKYAQSDRDVEGPGVILAPMPDHPIERCKADIGLLSHIIVSKFADHLPLYRQDAIFEREGVEIPRATMTSWILQIYDAIKPLEGELKRAVLDTGVLFTDDSIIPLQVKGNGRVKKARLSGLCPGRSQTTPYGL